MKSLHPHAITLAVALLVVSTGALAQAISKPEYQVGKDKVAADYKVAKAACAALSGNPRDICVAQAKGQKKIGKADLEVRYEPTEKHRYKLAEAKAEATYSVARERCDDLAGNAKDVCIKEAKAAEVTAKADAKVTQKSSDARIDANADKRQAQYRVEKEKCDALSGVPKTQCLDQAKMNFGTP